MEDSDFIERWILSGRDETLAEFMEREEQERKEIGERLDKEEAWARQQKINEELLRRAGVPYRHQVPEEVKQLADQQRRLSAMKPGALCAVCNVRADCHLNVKHNFVERTP